MCVRATCARWVRAYAAEPLVLAGELGSYKLAVVGRRVDAQHAYRVAWNAVDVAVAAQGAAQVFFAPGNRAVNAQQPLSFGRGFSGIHCSRHLRFHPLGRLGEPVQRFFNASLRPVPSKLLRHSQPHRMALLLKLLHLLQLVWCWAAVQAPQIESCPFGNFRLGEYRHIRPQAPLVSRAGEKLFGSVRQVNVFFLKKTLGGFKK